METLQTKIVEEASLLKFIPLLNKSLRGESGYVYEELIRASYVGSRFMSYFYYKALTLSEKGLGPPEDRVLKIILKIAQEGSRDFRDVWREPDYDEILRKHAKVNPVANEIRSFIFQDEILERDSDKSVAEAPHRSEIEYSGLGAYGTGDQKQSGFGNALFPHKETWSSKLQNLIEESLNFTDEKSKVLEECLSPDSPGDYVPIDIPQTSLKSETPVFLPKLEKPRVHVPGRAGGGWESDEDEKEESEIVDRQIKQISELALNMSSSELVVEMRDDMFVDESVIKSLEKMEIDSFCDNEKPVRSYNEATEAVDRLKEMNFLSALAILKSKISMEEGFNESRLQRSLVLLEVMLRCDLVKLSVYTQVFGDSLSSLLSQDRKNMSRRTTSKVKKIKYIIESFSEVDPTK